SLTCHRLAATRAAPAYINPRVNPTSPSPLTSFAEPRLTCAQHHQLRRRPQVIDLMQTQKAVLPPSLSFAFGTFGIGRTASGRYSSIPGATTSNRFAPNWEAAGESRIRLSAAASTR